VVVDSATAPETIAAFDFMPRTRVVFGEGAVEKLRELARELGGRKVLLVTDKGLADAGHEQEGVDALSGSGIEVTVFDEVHPNPTTEDVDRCLAVARRANVDLIVGLGGGSSMDCAKGCNFLLTNGGRIEDYWGYGKAARPLLPMIAVPTTAGTGSEAQSFAVIAHATTHMKMACGDASAACAIAVLDPRLTLSQPPAVTATTGMDAMSHAVETAVTTRRNPVSDLYSRHSWRLLGQNFAAVGRDPSDLPARSAMLLGAHWAGAAIENSMLGATHSLANPLSAHFDTVHGVAIAVMLPHVIRFNAPVVGTIYSKLAADLGLCDPDDPSGSDLLAAFVRREAGGAGLPQSLAECDIDPDLIPVMASEAARQWTAQFNPRAVDENSLEELYRCAYDNHGC
jgi:alcohol dehydrogenase